MSLPRMSVGLLRVSRGRLVFFLHHHDQYDDFWRLAAGCSRGWLLPRLWILDGGEGLQADSNQQGTCPERLHLHALGRNLGQPCPRNPDMALP